MPQQTDIFKPEQSDVSISGRAIPSQVFEMADAKVMLFEHFFSSDEADQLFERLRAEIVWQQDKIKMYGKEINLPRLTAWYGDQGKTYTYSGISMSPHAWTIDLMKIKKRIEERTNETLKTEISFTSALLNLYRNGKDSVGWHSDDEKELAHNPIIGSVSLGATRQFQMRHRRRKDLPMAKIPLAHGSFLLMAGTTQHHWEHQIPKTAQAVGERINLTFRVIG